MAEEAAIGKQPSMNILGQFIRDLSFENILAQKGNRREVSPDIQVQVGLDAKKRTPENQFEVVVKLKVDSKSTGNSDQLFLLELEYAGIFQISRMPEAQLQPFLLVECPRILFPYIRRIVSDITRDGGFPSLNLENIDFLQLYNAELGKKKVEEETAQKNRDRPIAPLN